MLILIILGIIVAILLFIGTGRILNDTSNNTTVLFMLASGLIILSFCIVGIIDRSYKEGYKQGNIDGYNCIYKYHLETQSDSSIIWVENKK